MPKIDADFLRNVQDHCNGGLEWCEKRDIERLDLVKVSVETAAIAAADDVGMASYGVAMFKLGYETRRAQSRNLLQGMRRVAEEVGGEYELSKAIPAIEAALEGEEPPWT